MEDVRRMEGHRQAKILFADCSSSNYGMFSGVVLILAVVVCSLVILTMGESSHYETETQIGNLLRLSVMTILTLASIYGYYVVSLLDVNPNPISFLDDLLLFFCLPSFFFFFILWTAHLIAKPDPIGFLTEIMMCLQVLIQTPMIIDGLRRCTNDPLVAQKMPGRNAITFLIVANLGVYIMESLLIKSYDYQKPKIDFYGADGWTVLSHITLPICVFYR